MCCWIYVGSLLLGWLMLRIPKIGGYIIIFFWKIRNSTDENICIDIYSNKKICLEFHRLDVYCIFLHVYEYMCTCILCTYMCVCVYVYMCKCVYVYMCKYVKVYMCTIYTHMRSYICVYAHDLCADRILHMRLSTKCIHTWRLYGCVYVHFVRNSKIVCTCTCTQCVHI